MIVVSTGTNGKAFDRLLTAVAQLETDEDMVVQHGPSSIRRDAATNVASLPFAEFTKLVAGATTVVTHAGVGSILVSLMGGVRPILVPRLARFGEAIDDHQLELAQMLESIGRATALIDLEGLLDAIRSKPGPRPTSPPIPEGTLVPEITAFLRESIHRTGRVADHRVAAP